jgi:hypothetical protein
MQRLLAVALLLAAPIGAFAAATSAPILSASRTLVASEAAPGNSYALAGDLAVASPVAGDLIAAAGSLTVSAPVGGDAMLAGGTVDIRKPVSGDLRVAAGHVIVGDAVGGDLMATGGVVDIEGTPRYAYVAGGRVAMTGGAGAAVRIYGSDVTIGGTYDGDVTVTVSDRLTVKDGTVIHGMLRYDAPAEAALPDTAVVDGGVRYTGTSYLPTAAEARTFAIAGMGAFILVRVLAGLIAAGLLAGLFPAFTNLVAERALPSRASRAFLAALLGFAIMVATPILLLLLAISFAGIGVALVVGAAYVLLMMLGYLYAGIIVGAALARAVVKRPVVSWRDALIGTLVLYAATALPVLGWVLLFLVWALATGCIALIAFRFAFKHEDEAAEPI